MTTPLTDSTPQTPQGHPMYTDLDAQYAADKPISGTHTLRQIIENVFAKVEGERERTRVVSNSRRYLRYDPSIQTRL